MSQSRTAVLSGSWYPADPGLLRRTIDGFLAAASGQHPAGRPLLAVVPHAGYTYSGSTAGRLYALLPAVPPARVVILAPNHRQAIDLIALSESDSFATPLGKVPVDGVAVARLAGCAACSPQAAAHAAEHAIEIQLPFLQCLWPDGGFSIVPLLVPHLAPGEVDRAAAALREVIDDDTLVIVSTDFTHYGGQYGYVPFRHDIPAALEKLDSGAILRILAADGPGLRAYGAETGITMCGLAAAALALDALDLKPGYEGSLIDYSRSADGDENFDLSVSYASILLTDGAAATPEDTS